MQIGGSQGESQLLVIKVCASPQEEQVAATLLDAASALHAARQTWVALLHSMISCPPAALVRVMRKQQQLFELQVIAIGVFSNRGVDSCSLIFYSSSFVHVLLLSAGTVRSLCVIHELFSSFQLYPSPLVCIHCLR